MMWHDYVYMYRRIMYSIHQRRREKRLPLHTCMDMSMTLNIYMDIHGLVIEKTGWNGESRYVYRS